MIIEFSVQNFRSIYDKVTLSMLASKLTGKEATLDNIFYHENYPNIPLLKSAVIYGANASGKSNVLKALEFFKKFTLNSTNYKFNQKLTFEPFRLLNDSTKEPSCFEMDFIAQGGVRYQYGFKINEDEILEEHLSIFTSRKETKLFSRKKGEKIQFSSAFKGEKRILEDQLLSNNLLLSKAANSNYEQMQKVYTYLGGINIYLNPIHSDNFSLKKSFEDPYFKNQITHFLREADTGIESFEIKKKGNPYNPENSVLSEEDKSVVMEILATYASYNAEVIHYSSDSTEQKMIRWDMKDESSGTQKLFALAGPIINILKSGETLIFDEINNSLHPHISKFIIKLFNSKEANPKNAQLIFTTHDATLLTKELFRRDQIWFTEKTNKGMTDLYSLSSFDKKDVRWDIPFDRWYLTGKFGAIPILRDFKMLPE